MGCCHSREADAKAQHVDRRRGEAPMQHNRPLPDFSSDLHGSRDAQAGRPADRHELVAAQRSSALSRAYAGRQVSKRDYRRQFAGFYARHFFGDQRARANKARPHRDAGLPHSVPDAPVDSFRIEGEIYTERSLADAVASSKCSLRCQLSSARQEIATPAPAAKNKDDGRPPLWRAAPVPSVMENAGSDDAVVPRADEEVVPGADDVAPAADVEPEPADVHEEASESIDANEALHEESSLRVVPNENDARDSRIGVEAVPCKKGP